MAKSADLSRTDQMINVNYFFPSTSIIFPVASSVMLPGNASRRPAKADSACRHQAYAGQVESALLDAIKFIPAEAC